ncbi:MAG: hypothetical protein U0835_09820 [Isosphaeraceae bacterium]
MSGAARRGGIPGPESRTGLVRPAMTEAEFERRQQQAAAPTPGPAAPAPVRPVDEPADLAPNDLGESTVSVRNGGTSGSSSSGSSTGRSRAARAKPVAKPRRVQRMFALEEELDKKLWLYAIHVGKDRSEVVNDLLRPIVASMVLYDSRDRRAARSLDQSLDRASDGNEGEAA